MPAVVRAVTQEPCWCQSCPSQSTRFLATQGSNRRGRRLPAHLVIAVSALVARQPAAQARLPRSCYPSSREPAPRYLAAPQCLLQPTLDGGLPAGAHDRQHRCRPARSPASPGSLSLLSSFRFACLHERRQDQMNDLVGVFDNLHIEACRQIDASFSEDLLGRVQEALSQCGILCGSLDELPKRAPRFHHPQVIAKEATHRTKERCGFCHS